MERFFTRRAGPPVTAWQERHAEEDFLALVRRPCSRWSSGHLPRRRVASGSRARTSSTHGPCATGWPRSWNPQRPCRRRSGQAGGATACRYSVEGVHRQMAPRLSQQWSLRSRSGHTNSHHEICSSLLRHLQGWDNRMIADHLAGMAGCGMSSDLGGWTRTRSKATNRETLSMRAFPSRERSATVLATQASRSPRV